MNFVENEVDRKVKKPRKKSVSKIESSLDLDDNEDGNDGHEEDTLKVKLNNIKLMYDI